MRKQIDADPDRPDLTADSNIRQGIPAACSEPQRQSADTGPITIMMSSMSAPGALSGDCRNETRLVRPLPSRYLAAARVESAVSTAISDRSTWHPVRETAFILSTTTWHASPSAQLRDQLASLSLASGFCWYHSAPQPSSYSVPASSVLPRTCGRPEIPASNPGQYRPSSQNIAAADLVAEEMRRGRHDGRIVGLAAIQSTPGNEAADAAGLMASEQLMSLSRAQAAGERMFCSVTPASAASSRPRPRHFP